MSKSKEQCLNIISQQFLQVDSNLSTKNKVLALEKTIKEISDSEYGLIWTYNHKTKILKTTNIEMSMSESVLKTVLLSKKVFFNNYLQSHKQYNEKIDNPLNINIKSILILPIFNHKNIIGFISAFNSMEANHEFQRYDTRSISLLSKYAKEVIELLVKNDVHTHEKHKTKEENKKPEVKAPETKKPEIKKQDVKKITTVITPKKPLRRKTKHDLENELKEQEKELTQLKQLLAVKDETLQKIQEEKAQEEKKDLIVVENTFEIHSAIKNINELKSILNFLTNEVTYLSHDEHALYTFLEIVKNSVHDKELLHFLNQELHKSQLITNFSDNLYNRDKIQVNNEEFKTFQEFSSVANLYTEPFSNENITFNIFINPSLPNKLIADIDKVQSTIVHLINNVKGLIGLNGVVELIINHLEKQEVLEVTIKGIQPEEKKKISVFFKSNVVSNHLTSENSGLGLSISSNLLNILGGKLKLTTEDNNEHSFTALVPVKKTKIINKQKNFKTKKPIKIAILVNKEDLHAYTNLRRYLDAFSIDKENIMLVYSYKKMNHLKISHFICFENMLPNNIDVKKFSSIIILKYSANPLPSAYQNHNNVHALQVNSYYGLSLQQILFPDITVEDLSGNTLLVKDTFFNKMTKRLRHKK